MAKQKGTKGGGAQKKSKGKKPPTTSSNNNSNNNSNGNKNGKNSRQRNKRHYHYQSSNVDDDDDANFRNSILNQGNTIKEMNSDGNCLFRSLSDQLHHDCGAKHDVVRHDVCNYLSKNKEEFQCFLLMEDDDEDVIDIDEYIAKMREVSIPPLNYLFVSTTSSFAQSLYARARLQDGEWGGNVEIVVASRVYMRNVIVFSGEYSNGALHIICDDKEKDGGDLLLSYHGNDHFNSVHPIGGGGVLRSKQSTKSTDGPSSSTEKNQKNGNNNQQTNVETATDQAEATTQSASAEKSSRSRPPTRGSNCPCGSGVKYKKCCMAQEKSKKRLAKHVAKHGEDDITENPDEKKEDEFIGDFRVLTI
ncbi:hypothetical protein ACHAXR_006454 [Thalassiosira sp. AJA248-18]